MSEDIPAWNERLTDQIAARIARREQMRALRAELAERRRHGKSRYHASRLRDASKHERTENEK